MRIKINNNELIMAADRAIRATDEFMIFCPIDGVDKERTMGIKDGYNAKISSFGIAIAMIDLLPTLASYCKDFPPNSTDHASEREPERKTKVRSYAVISAIAYMLNDLGYVGDEIKFDDQETRAKELFRYVVKIKDDTAEFFTLKNNIINCVIALKQVARTYKIVKNNESA